MRWADDDDDIIIYFYCVSNKRRSHFIEITDAYIIKYNDPQGPILHKSKRNSSICNCILDSVSFLRGNSFCGCNQVY